MIEIKKEGEKSPELNGIALDRKLYHYTIQWDAMGGQKVWELKSEARNYICFPHGKNNPKTYFRFVACEL